MYRKNGKKIWFVVLCTFIIQFFSMNSYADTSSSNPVSKASAPSLTGGTGGTVSGSGTVMPDLFTGTMSYSIPIEVPAGRKGMNPGLALTYRSDNGSGWVGVGWDLDVGAIERNASQGINYNGDDVLLRMSGSAINLMYDSTNVMYRAKIEGGFIRVTAIKDTYGNIISWIATDKAGTQYFYGSTAASRQDNPNNANQIFKWCLDKVQDTNGNYMKFSYFKNQGQIYLDRIDYTGNGTLQPTNYVKFYLEARNDAPVMNSTNFGVTTAYRLKTIDVFGNGNRIRAYALAYAPYSASTGRSLLASIQQYGKDAVVDTTYGAVTSGSALPAKTFGWQDSAAVSGTFPSSYNWTSAAQASGYTVQLGDFNGDGKTDIYMFNPSTGDHIVWLNNGDGTFPTSYTWQSGSGHGTGYTVLLGDFNGDGKTDIYMFNSSTGDHIVWLNNGEGIFPTSYTWQSGTGYGTGYTVQLGDFDGDGTTDIYMFNPSTGDHIVWLNNGHGTFPTGTTSYKWQSGAGYGTGYAALLGDFNGDGKADIYMFNTSTGDHIIWLNNGNGIFSTNPTNHPASYKWQSGAGFGTGYTVQLGDFNGDGRIDIYLYVPYVYPNPVPHTVHAVWLNNGDGTFPASFNWTMTDHYLPGDICSRPYCTIKMNETRVLLGDFNGDGKTDIYLYNPISGDNAVWLNNGDGTFPANNKWESGNGYGVGAIFSYALGDFNGDGKTDVYLFLPSSSTHNVWLNQGSYPDLLSSISNGIGGSTGIAYTPSTQYANTQLPFPIQTVSSVTTCDNYDNTTLTCKGNSSTTTYNYSGGFYHIGKRDFRGFNYVRVKGPEGPNGEDGVSETWFHQGDDTAVDANSPNVPTGYMKGKPYRTRVSDASGAIYTETTILYASGSSSAPFFNPPYQVDTYNCDRKLGPSCAGNAAAQHIQTVFNTYDQYGNVTSEYQSGNMNDSTDTSARTVSRTYSSNATAWIVNLPASETIYSAVTGSKMSSTSYYYDGTTTCTTASTSQPPTKGNPTCIARWVDGGANDPSVGMTYDAYGNLLTTRDPRGNTSRIGYDGTSTFPTTATNALGQNTTMQYYAGTSTDAGLYGQVKSTTDPNGAVTTMTYDSFGRKTRATAPDGTWMSWSYPITPGTGTSTNVFGAVGSQDNEIDTSAGISTWIYFDGLGRTIAEKKTGINGKVVTTTSYNKTGTVAQTSLPYFENTQQPSLITYTYDAMGRITRVNNPDGTSVSSCYDNGMTVVIDANTHFKRTTKNVQGKLVKVEEYEGTLAGCTTNVGTTPYAKTTYSYDVLGNLLSVTDNKLNITQMRYDSLGRKKYMSDPDTGVWQYGYDLNGNLLSQTDAKGQIITFTYDALNRVKLKHYQTGTDVSYTYDVRPDASSTITYPVGRRSTMIDASGSTKYFYDVMGRSSTMKKTVDGTPYATVASYDSGGRLASLQYPDTDVVYYSYDTGGNLKQVSGASTTTNYATFSNYNALGQPGNIAYGNGVNTTYTYNASNNRLTSLVTNGPNSTALLNLSYGYDYVGNITGITDGLNAARSQSFGYDELNRLTHANSASYVSNSYGPWQSGTCDEWVQQCPSGTGIDTCNSDSAYQFTCPSNSIFMTCNDVYDYMNLDLDQYYYRTVSCGPQPSYVYDEIGNILSKEGINYDQYGLNAGPHAVTHTSDGKAYTYDANGNMKTDGTRVITYNYDNMPQSITVSGVTTTFVYDGSGMRVKKIRPSATTVYIGKLYECVAGACSKYIFAGGTRIAHKASDTVYFTQDHLGSTRIVTDANGNKSEDIYYYPFGGAQSDSGAVSMTYKYTSQEFDAETGLYNYNARLYNPSLGRFTNPDTIVPDPSNPQAFNRYSYVINNPIMYTDPSGHDFWSHLKHEASRPQNAFVIQNLNFITGTYFLMQSQTGRQILVGEAIIGAAALGYAEATPETTTEDAYQAGIDAAANTGPYDGTLVAANGSANAAFYSTYGPAAATQPIDWETSLIQFGQFAANVGGYGSAAYITYEAGSAIASGLSSASGRSGGGGSPSGSAPSGGGSGGGLLGSSAGGSAAQYWANMYNNTGAWYTYGMGLAASLWTPETSMRTFEVLTVIGGNGIGYVRGQEISVGDDFRIAPWGNRTGNPNGELPHYHRRIYGPDDNVIPGGGIGWHRPWEQGW